MAGPPQKRNPTQAYSISYQRGDGPTYRFSDVSKIHPSLKLFFCYGLNKAGQRMKIHLEESLHPLGVQAIHVGALKILESGEKVNQIRLAEEMGLDKATMVKIVDHLESKKLVKRQRSTEDRRSNDLQLTEAGSKLLARAQKVCEQAERTFLKNLTDAEVKVFKSTLLRLLK